MVKQTTSVSADCARNSSVVKTEQTFSTSAESSSNANWNMSGTKVHDNRLHHRRGRLVDRGRIKNKKSFLDLNFNRCRPNGSRMMPPVSLQIWLRGCANLWPTAYLKRFLAMNRVVTNQLLTSSATCCLHYLDSERASHLPYNITAIITVNYQILNNQNYQNVMHGR